MHLDFNVGFALVENNLTRCTLGAVFVSVIDLVIKRLGIGWTYVLLCGITLLLVPLTYLATQIGPRSRNKRGGNTEQ